MKPTRYLTAVLLSALAMPMSAQDTPPADPPVQAGDADEAIDPGEFRIEFDENGSLIIVRIIDEEKEEKAADGQKGDIKIEVPDMIQLLADVPEPIEATFLGVATQPMTSEAAKAVGLEKTTGLQVSFIKKDSPAAEAGLQKNDVLLKLNDQVLINAEQLVVLIRSFEPGEKVTMHGIREGESFKTEVTLSKAMVRPVGPGGATLDQTGWRLQQLRGPVEGDPAGMAELLLDVQQKQDQKAQQLVEGLDFDFELMLGGANGGQLMLQSKVVKNDGQHSIILKSGQDGRHLTIKNKAGEVLYDGLLPAEDVEKHLIEDNGLPLDIFKKVEPMLNANIRQLDLKIDGQLEAE